MKKITSLMITLCALLCAGTMTVYASSSTKTISSITVRVGTDLEAGDYTDGNIDVYDDSTDSHDGTYAATNSAKYEVAEAEWVTSDRKALQIGDTPKMKLYIYITDTDYAFKGSYSSSNISVRGGTFVSAKRVSTDELQITVRVKGIKGTYDAPDSLTWKDSPLGRAYWYYDDNDDANTSGYYDIYLYRGSTCVKKVESYKGNTYNFYPYMTKAGTYTYHVRTVPYTSEEKEYGKRSDWAYGDEIYINAESVSDGSGAEAGTSTGGTSSTPTTTTEVGWIQSGSDWYYRYPDGSFQKDWLQLGNYWYLFDSNGKMLTGWQTKNGLTYYIQSDGKMYSGWLKTDGDNKWYYMNQASDGVEGAMHTGWLVKDGKTYYMGSDGAMSEGWTNVDGNWYYFYPNVGYKAVNTTINTFYVDANGVWRK